MPPKSKPEAQQSSAKTVLDNSAQQPNSGAPVSSDSQPGGADVGEGQPVAPTSASVTGQSSTDTPGLTASEVLQPNSSGPTSPDSAVGATDIGGGQLSATDLDSVAALSPTDTPGLPSADQPTLNRYQVTGVSSIQHDGTLYEAGDDIYLTDRDALGLLDGRFIVPTQEF